MRQRMRQFMTCVVLDMETADMSMDLNMNTDMKMVVVNMELRHQADMRYMNIMNVSWQFQLIVWHRF